jgi:hypothetical protein
MLKKLTLCLLLLLATNAYSQVLFEDASGESSIFLSDTKWSWIRINSGDESFTMGYNYQRGAAGHDYIGLSANRFIGADVKIKSNDGIGKVLSGGKLNPGINFTTSFGLIGDPVSKKNHFHQYFSAYIRAGISYNSLTYIDTALLKTTDVNKVGFNVTLHFNRVYTHKHGAGQGFLFIGGSAGVKLLNNYDALDDGIIVTTVKSTNAAQLTTTEEGKIGAYDDNMVVPVKLDIGYLPRIAKSNRFGVNAYFRSDFFKPSNGYNLGFGTFLTTGDNIRAVVGGIAWQFNDISNVQNSTESAVKRSTLFFYAGYTIGK